MSKSLPRITETGCGLLLIDRELIWKEARNAVANRILTLALRAGELARNDLSPFFHQINKQQRGLAIEAVNIIEQSTFHNLREVFLPELKHHKRPEKFSIVALTRQVI